MCIDGFCGGLCIMWCGVWVVSCGLRGYIRVGRGGVLVGRGPREDWVRLVYSELGILLSAVVLRPCVVGAGIHALYWNMLSLLELGCSRVLLGLHLRQIGRAVNGVCMLSYLRAEVAWVVGLGSVRRLVAFSDGLLYTG